MLKKMSQFYCLIVERQEYANIFQYHHYAILNFIGRFILLSNNIYKHGLGEDISSRYRLLFPSIFSSLKIEEMGQCMSLIKNETRASLSEVCSFLFNLKIEELYKFEMDKRIRSEGRLLSSLKDLKLDSSHNIILTEERKRNYKKLCPIKVRLEDEMVYENFKIVDKKKCAADFQFISYSLSKHFTFSSLIENKNLQDQLIDKFRLCRVEENQYLMKQNDNPSSFFILKSGQLIVQVNGDPSRTIHSGEGFGELALLYSTPRSASIYANKASLLWFIDRLTFQNIVSTIIQKTYAENKKFIEMNKFFSYLTQKQKQKLASIAIVQRYEKGAKLCKQGELGSAMFILKNGKLKRSINGICVGYYQNGDSLQEYSVLDKNVLRKQTLIFEESSQIIAFGAEEIEKTLGKSLPIIILRNNAKKILLQDKYFKLISKQLLDKVIDCFKIKNINAEERAFQIGDFCKNKILFVIEGQYVLSKKEEKPVSLFGTESIRLENRMMAYDFDCLFKSEGKIAEATIQDIEVCIGISLNQAIQKNISLRKTIENRRSHLLDLKQLAEQFQLKDFYMLKKLGEGQFGQVYLVTYGKSNKLFALKCISKAETLKYKLQKHLINEKKVLETHSSPFTIDFIRSYKDEHYVYFLTQFIDGLELFDALRVIGLVPLSLSRFYTAILLHTLQTLHQNNIIYRDLKPENVMVQSDGYLKVIDMGTCKNLKNSLSNKTFTIIGTPNYMAPQILSGRGYSYSSDLWSLGIVLFQFLSGYLPFGEHCDDPYQIYQQILATQLKFPKYMNDHGANSLILKLLNKNGENRLGGTYSQLKNHQFFAPIEWSLLLEKKMVPSFKPPKENLVKIESLTKNMKPFNNFLKHPPQGGPKRTDLNPYWDSCF